MRIFSSLRRIPILRLAPVWLLLAAMNEFVSAAEPLELSQLSKASQRLASSRAAANRSEILPRVRETTWQLLFGEMAGDAAFGLSSSSFDELTRGLKQLDQLIVDLKAKPELDRDLSKDLQLAMRFDAMQARRTDIERQRDISRAEELERLKQLREINGAYRELIRNLMRLQTSKALGQNAEFVKLGDDSVKLMSDIEKVVGRRRDFYLFHDEPPLAIEADGELSLVRELAQPMANDVRRHQLALQAFTLAHLSTSITSESRKNLETAKGLAEAALAGSDEPHVLANWALAIICREMGRLETTVAPWDQQSHERAAPLFELARKNLTLALSQAPEDRADLAWVAEVERQLAELASPDGEIRRAMTLLDEGNPRGAASVIERCATLHRSGRVGAALTDCQRFAGESLKEMDRLVDQLWTTELFSDNDSNSRLIRGRQGVLSSWRQLSEERRAEPADDWQSALAKRLEQANSDLEFAAKSAVGLTQRLAECHRALGAVVLLSIAPDTNPESARVHLSRVPMLIAEIEQDLGQAPVADQLNCREAIIAGRLAHGYLALRLLPDYRNTAPKAFAGAIEARAMVSASLTMPQVLGARILQSLSSRADGADTRLAQEEQFVRQSLQRVLPGLVAMQLAPSTAAANNLLAVARNLEAVGENTGSRTRLDPRDTTDARTTAGTEMRTATILAFLAANQPKEALRESLIPLRSEIRSDDLDSIDAKSLRDPLIAESDPVRQSIVGLAIEEYAAVVLQTTDDSARGMMALVLELQQIAGKRFRDSSIMQKTHPAEVEMNRQALKRLTDPDFYLAESRQLISDLRMSDARKLLNAGTRRHPDSTALREALVQTLIDEADLRPERSTALIKDAIEQLQTLTTNSKQDVSDSLLKLAGLYERTDGEDRARVIYRQIVDQAGDGRQRLLARSRLTVLQVRSPKP